MASNKPAASAPAEKKVKIKIPLVRGETNQDVYVSVNDKSWQIKRGVTVEVPECVAEVLEHEEKQLRAAYDYQDEQEFTPEKQKEM